MNKMLIAVKGQYINVWESDNPPYAQNCDAVIGYEILNHSFEMVDGGEYDFNSKNYFLDSGWKKCSNKEEMLKFIHYVFDDFNKDEDDYEILSTMEICSIDGQEKEGMQLYAMDVIQEMIDNSKIPWSIYSNGDNTILPMNSDNFLRDDGKILTDDGDYYGYISIPNECLLLWDEEEQNMVSIEPKKIQQILDDCLILDEMNGTENMIQFANLFFENTYHENFKRNEFELER